VSAGRVGRPHGLDGSFHVLGAAPELLMVGAKLCVQGAVRAVERRAGTDERPIVRLAGAGTRADAEELRGAELLVAREDLPPLDPDEFWAADLVGCRVVDGGREVGVVRRMVALPSCEALEVGELLIPLVRDAIRSIDVDTRVIDVDLGFVGEP
jgi:16S rRNA processing protein RimM